MAEKLSREKTIHLKKLQQLQKELPWYVQEYFDVKRQARMSPTTLSQYARDFLSFFKWLKAQGISDKDISLTPIEALSELRKSDAKAYVDYLEIDRQLSLVTINRNISSLKSLFYYLSNETEDDEGECYFNRNVFAKIPLLRDTTDHSQKANQVANMIFQGNTDKDFLEYIVTEYPKQLKGRPLALYKRHAERDVAIISLLLGTGMRVSELVHLTIDDIHFDKQTVSVHRKGDKKSVIIASESSLEDVKAYLEVRRSRYKVPAGQKHLFLSYYGKEWRPLSIRAVQHLVAKYTQPFVMKMSPHKFRHTFATKHWLANKDQISLMEQLGHNSMETTTIYTNMTLEDKKEQMKRMESYKNQD